LTLNLIEGFETTSNQLSACMIHLAVIEIIFIGAWRSLEARLLWEQEVGGSNPLAPTSKIYDCGATNGASFPYAINGLDLIRNG
jgi:hypothetical protein